MFHIARQNAIIARFIRGLVRPIGKITRMELLKIWNIGKIESPITDHQSQLFSLAAAHRH